MPRAQRATPCADATVIDSTGKYLIPGLADMHVHLFEHGRDDKGELRPRFDRATIVVSREQSPAPRALRPAPSPSP